MFTVISILIIAEAFSGNLVNAECKEYGFHDWESGSIGKKEVIDTVPVMTPKNKGHLMNGRTFENSLFFCEQLCLRDKACMAINLEPTSDKGVRKCHTMGNDKKGTKRNYQRRTKYCLPDFKYDVTILTGNEDHAGTNADVFMIIKGENGDTKKTILDGPGDDFELGEENSFEVVDYDVGTPKYIVLWRNTYGTGEGWMCESVSITLPSGAHYSTVVHAWITTMPTEYEIEPY